jgi:hypothetical protein
MPWALGLNSIPCPPPRFGAQARLGPGLAQPWAGRLQSLLLLRPAGPAGREGNSSTGAAAEGGGRRARQPRPSQVRFYFFLP